MAKVCNETQCLEEGIALTWKIKAFSMSPLNIENNGIQSETILVGGVRCSVFAYYDYSRTATDYALFIDVQNHEKYPHSNRVVYCITIINKKGEQMFQNTGQVCAGCHSNFELISKKELLKCKHILVPNDCLTLSCKFYLRRIKQEISEDICNQHTLSCSRLEEFPKDFGNLRATKRYSDARIRVEGKDIEIHSLILSARSPVFAAMFQSGMVEARERVIEIDDVREPVMNHLLEFIYTGELQSLKDLPENVITEIYIAADKYNIADLKDMCFGFLLDKLSLENIESYVLLATKHSDEKMLNSIATFVKRRELIRQKTVQDIAKKMPEFAMKLLNTFAKID